MGYFSNGTEGLLYQERYCDRCVHDIHQDCPIWSAHLVHNYAEANNDESILHRLIPLTKDHLDNEQCLLFIERPTIGDLFEEEPK